MRYICFYILLTLFLQADCSSKKQSTAVDDGIELSSLTAEGIDSTMIQSLDSSIQKGIYPNIHSLLIARNDKLVHEKYWDGKDEDWGSDVGVTIHAKDSLHDIRSISKSIVSACIGIALEQGRIKSVEQKVFDFFPEYARLDTGLKSGLSIKHLLTMSSGLAWNEDIPYDNPENSEIKMTRSPDPIAYVLSQPMDYSPGKVWKYNGGTTQLLAVIIKKTTGKSVDEFAKEYLFQPLGIAKFEWVKYPGTNMPAAASGLRLRSRDLLKFGLLYFNQGEWKGKQIIAANWIQESFQSHIARPGSNKTAAYGYQFWVETDTILNRPTDLVACVGNGDQRIYFDKKNGLVVVITAGNYNKWDIKNNSAAILKNYIYPALIR
jgi:CubicO group peptidase (beta-lactamase class C family)